MPVVSFIDIRCICGGVGENLDTDCVRPPYGWGTNKNDNADWQDSRLGELNRDLKDVANGLKGASPWPRARLLAS